MTRIPAITISPDPIVGERLHVSSFNQLQANPDAWHALRKWLSDHGIDDRTVAANESIIRNPESRTIEYTTFETDADGRKLTRGGDWIKTRVVHQLDKMPMPWPTEVLELAERTRA